MKLRHTDERYIRINVEELRRLRGNVTQQDLVTRINAWAEEEIISLHGYQNLEKSQRCRRRTARIFANYYGCKLEDLLLGLRLPPKLDFFGRSDCMEALRKALIDRAGKMLLTGEPGSGKTALAEHFTHYAKEYKKGRTTEFQAVLYQRCSEQPEGYESRRRLSILEIVEQLARQIARDYMGKEVEDLRGEYLAKSSDCGTDVVAQNAAWAGNWLTQRRVLVVFDDIWQPPDGSYEAKLLNRLIPSEPASVLFTSRRRSVFWTLKEEDILDVGMFNKEDAKAVFSGILRSRIVPRHEKALLAFADRVGCLPIAVVVGAHFIQDKFAGVDETARELFLEKLIDQIRDVPAFLNAAIEEQGENEKLLLIAAAFCDPEGFWWPFVVNMMGRDKATGDAVRDHLVHSSLLKLEDQDEQMFRLHALIWQLLRAKAVSPEILRRAHLQAVVSLFQEWESRTDECINCLGEIVVAVCFLWSQSKEDALALASCGYSFALRTGELAKALRIEQEIQHLAEEGRDDQTNDILQKSYSNQAVILHHQGRFDDARDLLQKKERICLELQNDKRNMNQSDILKSLRICYMNQASLLKDRGHLEEAMEGLKKHEAICEDRKDLQSSLGGQAVIHDAWGDYEQALKLLNRQERICVELELYEDLQDCLGNQGGVLMHMACADQTKATREQHLAEALKKRCRQKGLLLSRVRDNDSLQICVGNQADILMMQGKLKPARKLLKKKEAICIEMGKAQGLAFCAWSWATLADLENDPVTRKQKLEEAREGFHALGMRIEEAQVQRELDSLKLPEQ